jgi:hypothetical protein
VINAQVKIENVKDVEYRRKSGEAATFKALGIKNADGTWLNISVFDEIYFSDCVAGAVVDVAYTEKYATEPNGQPKMYNGQQVIYRTATSVLPAKQGAQSTAPVAQGSQKAPFDPNLSARQTAANDSTQIVCAEIRQGGDTETLIPVWDTWFKHILSALTGEDIIADAREKLDAVDEDTDDDIPFLS